MPHLPAIERRALKSRAHALRPVVIVGAKGLTESVLKEAEVALTSHELVKIKLASDDRAERAHQFEALAAALGANPVQQIGKIAILYREKPETPAPRRKPATQPTPSRAASRPPSSAPKRDRGRSGEAPAPSSRRAPPRPRAARRPRPRP